MVVLVDISIYNCFMRQVGLNFLGHFEVCLDGPPLEAFRCSKKGALFAYLAVESNRPHRREALAEMFWPDRPGGVARNNLRQALLRIRQAIQDHGSKSMSLETSANTIQINRSSNFLADIDIFERKIRSIRSHTHENLETCLVCRRLLEKATGLYRGEFLDGIDFDEGGGFHEWMQFHRRYYFCQQLEALQHLANCYQYLNQYDMAYRCALRQLKMDPVKESAHRQIMRLFALSGQRSAAIEQYKICCQNLADELGIEPETETVTLFEQIKAGKTLQDK